MRTTFLAAALALFATFTAQAQTQRPAAQVPTYTCKIGDHVPEINPGMFRISTVAVWQDPSVHNYVAAKKVVGDYALPLLQAAEKGEVPHWDGHSTIEIRIHYVNEAAMPREV